MSEENKFENTREEELPMPNGKCVKNASEREECSTFGKKEEHGYSIERLYSEEPDERESEKKTRKKIKVSLGTFVVSFVALMLAAVMVTWTVCQSLYRKQIYNILENGFGMGDLLDEDDDFAELELVRSLLQSYSYFDLTEEDMLDAAIKSYVYATGDRYAEYFNEEEFEEYNKMATGNSVGVGINIIYTTQKIGEIEYKVLKVINVTKDSPAMQAGVMIGDLVFYVGNDPSTRRSIHEIGYEEAYASMIGEVGTQAEFTVFRADESSDIGYKEVAFSITRQKIVSSSIYSHVCETDPSVGIIKITGFEYNTPVQFSEAVDALKAKGINKFVFDVRYNGGGALHSIVAVLSYFLDEGDTVISTVDKSGNKSVTTVKPISTYTDESAPCNVSKDDIGKYKDLEVAVLCNDSTASAAELFVATFRDYKIGKTVGVTTFGKGSMQSIISLDYFGYRGAVKLTTNMYFPPCGESYEGVGITPDVTVALDESLLTTNVYEIADADDNQLQAAIKTFE